MAHRWTYLLAGAVLLGLGIWLSWPAKKLVAPTTNTAATNQTNSNQSGQTNTSTTNGSMITFSTADLPDRDPAYDFTVSLPSTWRVEYLSAGKAIQVYEQSVTEGKAIRLFITTQTVSTLTRPTGAIGTATIIPADATHPERQQYTVQSSAASSRPSWWTQQHQTIIFANWTMTPASQYTFAFAPTVTASTITSIAATMQTATQ
jgi:hypothetical protein